MITIILQDRDSLEIERISEENNSEYIIQENSNYKYLQLLSDYSYDVFLPEDMHDLMQDLIRLKSKLKNVIYQEHIAKVIELSEKCKNTDGSSLVFTPWPDE